MNSNDELTGDIELLEAMPRQFACIDDDIESEAGFRTEIPLEGTMTSCADIPAAVPASPFAFQVVQAAAEIREDPAQTPVDIDRSDISAADVEETPCHFYMALVPSNEEVELIPVPQRQADANQSEEARQHTSDAAQWHKYRKSEQKCPSPTVAHHGRHGHRYIRAKASSIVTSRASVPVEASSARPRQVGESGQAFLRCRELMDRQPVPRQLFPDRTDLPGPEQICQPIPTPVRAHPDRLARRTLPFSSNRTLDWNPRPGYTDFWSARVQSLNSDIPAMGFRHARNGLQPIPQTQPEQAPPAQVSLYDSEQRQSDRWEAEPRQMGETVQSQPEQMQPEPPNPNPTAPHPEHTAVPQLDSSNAQQHEQGHQDSMAEPPQSENSQLGSTGSALEDILSSIGGLEATVAAQEATQDADVLSSALEAAPCIETQDSAFESRGHG